MAQIYQISGMLQTKVTKDNEDVQSQVEEVQINKSYSAKTRFEATLIS